MFSILVYIIYYYALYKSILLSTSIYTARRSSMYRVELEEPSRVETVEDGTRPHVLAFAALIGQM